MNRIWRWWARHFLFVEFLLALVVAVCLTLSLSNTAGKDWIRSNIHQSPSTVLSALVSLFGALFGFAITAVSVIAALIDRPRFERLRGSRRLGDLWATLTQTLSALGGSAGISMVGLLLVDAQSAYEVLLGGLLFLTILSALRLMRTVWILGLVLNSPVATGESLSQRKSPTRIESIGDDLEHDGLHTPD